MQAFAKEVMEKMRELDAEKMKTEKAFHDFLPASVVRAMKKGKVGLSVRERSYMSSSQGVEGTVLAEHFDCVTIFYGDIIGFSGLISDCSANEVRVLPRSASIDHRNPNSLKRLSHPITVNYSN